MAARNGLNGQTLRKQYKENISCYRKWDQLDHADEYLLFPDNIGSDLSLDETCPSNGEVYTLLTNKAAHGRKGTLVAMIRGVATDAVSAILYKLPSRIRNAVQTVTTDLSSAMMLTVRKVFPKATLINDRFHVQQLMSEAIDRMRIRLRWQVLEEENKALKENRDRRKAAQNRKEREAVGYWEPCRMSNGETMPQVMARSRHILLKHESKWNEQQRSRAEVLFNQFPELEKAYRLSSHPLKSPFLRDIVQIQYPANFLKHVPKSFHGSFEVIGRCCQKHVYSISRHTLIKVAAQSVIRFQMTYCWFYTCTLAEEFMFFLFLITAV